MDSLVKRARLHEVSSARGHAGVGALAGAEDRAKEEAEEKAND